MSDTIRLRSALLTLMSLSEEGFSGQDIRDAVVSMFNSLAYADVIVSRAATQDDRFIYADATSGTVTITLPAVASSTGMVLTVKRKQSGGSNVVLDGNASETIDGATTYSLTAQYQKVTIICSGTEWLIIST